MYDFALLALLRFVHIQWYFVRCVYLQNRERLLSPIASKQAIKPAKHSTPRHRKAQHAQRAQHPQRSSHSRHALAHAKQTSMHSTALLSTVMMTNYTQYVFKHVLICIRMHPYVFSCICPFFMHSHARICSYTPPVHIRMPEFNTHIC